MLKRTSRTTTSIIAILAFALLSFANVGAADEKKAAKPAPAAKDAPAFDVNGNWFGTLDVGVAKLRLGFVVKTEKSGEPRAALFSIDQGNAEIPVDAVEVKGDTVAFEIKPISARFDGKWDAKAGTLVGKFKQGPMSFNLTLEKVDALPGTARPQEPKKPYPYEEQEVSFKNEKHNVTLNGTLTVPKGKGPFPAVVLISGSGPQDRNEELLGHKPFLVLADALTRRGIAVLRYDDRDFTNPKLTFQVTFSDHAEDAFAGVKFLQSRPEIRSDKIGLVGHSEGAIAAPLLAAREKDVAFIVMIAGPGMAGDKIHLEQTVTMLKHAGLNDEQLKQQSDAMAKIHQVLKEERDDKAAFEKLEAIAKDSLIGGTKEERDATIAAFKAQAKTLLSPWFRYFIAYDPRPTLTKIACPVLAVIGEKDFQVPARENLSIIESALKEGKNRDHVVKELPGLNHLLQPCTTGMLDEYSQIETTMDPGALALICDWVVERTK